MIAHVPPRSQCGAPEEEEEAVELAAEVVFPADVGTTLSIQPRPRNVLVGAAAIVVVPPPVDAVFVVLAAAALVALVADFAAAVVALVAAFVAADVAFFAAVAAVALVFAVVELVEVFCAAAK
jgi:hypothetical protein